MSKRIIIVAGITLALGLGGGYWLASRHMNMSMKMSMGTSEKVAKADSQKKPLFYRNPMHPTVTSPVPAKDNMGMDYIPVYADDASSSSSAPGTVVINPTVEQSIGVRTAIASKKEISRTIQTVGRVDFDEELLTRLHPKISGWIEKLFVDKTGAAVKPDTMLLSIYSPQLVASEEEYLLALKNVETLKASPFPDIRRGAEDLLRSSRERLELLDVPKHQMEKLKKTRKIMKALHIHSPATGVILKVGAREGQHVTPNTELYAIADLSRVWAYVDVYEYEIPWVRLHDKAEMHLAALPGQTFKGKITYIYPYLDPKTRTNKVRLEFDNTQGLLKPDMFADVTIRASRKASAIVIPSEAIIRTGRIPKVFVKIGKGRFEPRNVRLGLQTNGETEILEGVKSGELVVTSAQFLIDSESSLKEAAAKMVAPKKNNSPQRHQVNGEARENPLGDKDTKKGMKMDGMDMGDMKMDGMDMKGMQMPGMSKKGDSHE